jgi:uncharacterized membrane protein
VDRTDRTVVTVQATVDYGYCWFSLSEGPVIVRAPGYRYQGLVFTRTLVVDDLAEVEAPA